MDRRILAATVVLMACAMAGAQLATANFNAATGSSGKDGFTCTSCHNVPDRGPAGQEEIYDEPAKVSLDGLPVHWNLGQQYLLTITVTGGPPAAPEPAPQGGFEIESNLGWFSVPAGMESLIEVYDLEKMGVTYTAEGTLVREWQLSWQAPTLPADANNIGGPALARAPEPVTFWVAGMAANGNHIVAAGQSDGGELGDSVDNMKISVLPSQNARDEWYNQELLPPLVDGETLADRYVSAFQGFTIKGAHFDDEASILNFQLDGGEWTRQATIGANWILDFSGGLDSGEHTLSLQSEAEDGRVSATSKVIIHVESLGEVLENQAPTPILLSALALFAAAIVRRRA